MSVKAGSSEGVGPMYKHVIDAMEHVHSLSDGKGVTVCPRCGGILHYEKKSAPTGREWSKAKCETKGCISWIV